MTTNCTDEQAILDLMAKWRSALERKDTAAMMEDYLPDALLFDAKPPYKIEGAAGIRKVWEQCLPYFPEEFESEHRDLRVHVDGDLALVYGLHHFVPTPADHPCGQTWVRITIGFQRVDGRWRVAHEHASLPFNPMNGQAWFIPNPNELTLPDYTAGGCEGECES
ncbi:MAG: SgcJ/EcaC family oxidoreductase [Planctomycetales bacterium]|nr:SgcJ/EcaC family oxidoreductase [Planctomycetales bacterium]